MQFLGKKKVYSNLLRTPTIHEIEFIWIMDMWCKDPLSTSNERFKWNHKCILHAILYAQIFMWFQVIEIMLKSLHHVWLRALDSKSHARLVFCYVIMMNCWNIWNIWYGLHLFWNNLGLSSRVEKFQWIIKTNDTSGRQLKRRASSQLPLQLHEHR
jgi:hypothetical protein